LAAQASKDQALRGKLEQLERKLESIPNEIKQHGRDPICAEISFINI
jgi:hypothetical protein